MLSTLPNMDILAKEGTTHAWSSPVAELELDHEKKLAVQVMYRRNCMACPCLPTKSFVSAGAPSFSISRQ